MRFVWLHGFSSGPQSGKAAFVRERLAGRGVKLEVPDLNQPFFRELTITRMLGQIDGLLDGDEAVLFGSSLGGFTAAIWSATRPGRARSLVLLAPAFELATRWKRRMGAEEVALWRERGVVEVEHYAWGRKEALSIGYLDDAEQYAPFPLPDAPTLVIQGTRDDVVEPDLAPEFARRMRERNTPVRLVELDDRHELNADLPRLWREISAHLAPLLDRR